MSIVLGYYNFIFENMDRESFVKMVLPEFFSSDSIKYLSNGANGAAFDIGNNMVLKITNDIVEANTAAWLLNYNYKCISTIYSVYKIETDKPFPRNLNIRFPYWNDTFFIILEKLDTSISTEVDDFLQVLVQNFPFDKRKNTVLTMLNKREVNNYFKDSKYSKLYKEIKFMLETLKVDGLNFYDLHGGNIGRKRTGELAMFDVYFKNKKGFIQKRKI